MAKMSLEFDGLKNLLYRIDELEGDLRPAVDEALTKVQHYVQDQTRQAAAKYVKGGTEYATGKMKAAVKPDSGPTWAGNTAKVGVGFDIRKPGGGGMHSIWMMYGTPRIKPDKKLYGAIRGQKTKIQILKIMTETLQRHVNIESI